MTSIATVFGAIPLAIAGGAGGAARAAIGIVIVFGVTLATLITLVLIPIIYSMLAKYTGSPEAVSRRLENRNEDAGNAFSLMPPLPEASQAPPAP